MILAGSSGARTMEKASRRSAYGGGRKDVWEPEEDILGA